MIDFFDVVRFRRSVRSFQTAGVSDDDLQAVLDAMNHAPSAGDLQAYEVVVVREAGQRRRLARASHDQLFVADAPVVIVFFMNPDRGRHKYGSREDALYACQDATIAAAYAQLAAAALGLGSVWVGAFDDDAVCRVVDAPVGLRPSSLLVVGHPAEVPEPTPRRAIDDLVRWERFEDHSG